MTRAVIVGSGSEIAPTRVTNAQMARIMDTSDEWIRERSGVEERHFATPDIATSDLGVAAAAKALDAAGVAKDEVDLVVFATMTPDHYFPGCGTLLQHKLGLRHGALLRHPAAVLGLPLRAAARGRARPGGPGEDRAPRRGRGAHRLHALDAGELRLRARRVRRAARRRRSGTGTRASGTSSSSSATPARPSSCGRSEGGDRGVLDHELHGAGADYEKLYVPGTGFKHRPYTDPEQFKRGDHIPVMDGRYVFKMATTQHGRGGEVGPAEERRRARSELKLVLMHQANKRINEYCAKALGLREEQVPHNIHKYGNTTAATIPLLWDECARDGRLRPGDLVLMVAFGAGMTWGASLVRA